MYACLRPLLFRLDAEAAHDLTLRALDGLARWQGTRLLAAPATPLPTRCLGIVFPNPVGLAAGLDKDGAHIDALGALGFGFIEVGTVTPRPQAGNPRPRLFRLERQHAIINRMGFNNAGVDALVRNVERRRWRGVLGINIGRNKATPNERATDDYLYCLRRVYALADYVTVNISSPNTAGLRDLQRVDALRRFIGTLREAQEQLAARHGRRTPMLVKIAPDLAADEVRSIAAILIEADVDGVICTNTTVDRSRIAGHPHAQEAGGLSGAPLRQQADAVLAQVRDAAGDKLALIGVGGILAGGDATAKRAAGAALVQLYSGLVYRGPGLVRECVDALRRQAGAA